MTISRLLGRLKALQPAPSRGKTASAPGTVDATPRGHSPDIPEGAAGLAEILAASVRSNKFGEHLALRKWFSEPVASAPDLAVPDGELNSDALRLMAPGAPREIADPRQWLFLDTETTGLAGGTGTYPFLIGVAWWDAGGLEVEQFFMRDYSDEHSVLLALAERIGGAARPGYLQREILRLAAARNTLPDDSMHSRPCSARPSRFSASGAKSLAPANRIGAPGGT